MRTNPTQQSAAEILLPVIRVVAAEILLPAILAAIGFWLLEWASPGGDRAARIVALITAGFAGSNIRAIWRTIKK